MIRAVKLAQHLGVSSSELRKFISEVNFGVKPTDREMPESIANGIVRYVARKLNRKIAPLIDFEENTEDQKKEKEESVMEKLTKIAQISREDTIEKDKTNEEENEAEDSQEVVAKKSDATQQNQPKTAPAIFRKIEIAPEEAAKAKKKMEKELEEKTKTKEEKEIEKMEEKVFAQSKRKESIYKKKEGIVYISNTISVKEFSEKIGVPVSEIVKELLKNGVLATINKVIDFDTCSIIASELNVEVKKEESVANAEDLLSQNLEKLMFDDSENLSLRAPVVVVMGHVDHGKTKILDSIRKTKVAEGEAGGITQHIGAYQVESNGKKITFLDTPGHEAFTAMRARGAKTADVAILVVAADEGIKEQTIEAINHAKEAKIPIVVAINKVDRPNANIDKVKGELANQGLNPEDWGGDTICVPTSALKGEGIANLLEMVLLTTEMQDLKANPNRLAVGTVVESHLDEAFGPVATILINTGTLKISDDFLIGRDVGRIKTMISDEGKKIKSAPPSTPVQISGLSEVPSAGEILQVFKSKKIIKEKLEELKNFEERKSIGLGVTEIMDQLKKGKMKFLKIVLRADTDGSLEAVKQAIERVKHEEVEPKIIHSAVGGITETDVIMAAASQGVVFGFNVRISPRVKRIAEKEKVEVKNFDIIFELTDTLKKILEGLLEPEIEEINTGTAEVKKVFWSKGKVLILGCKINKGYLELDEKLQIYRGEELIGNGRISILQHFEKKVKRIDENQECGIQFEGNIKIEEGDRIEGYKSEQKIKTFN